MIKIKDWFMKTFWTGYNTFEKIFLFAMVALQIVVFVINPDTPLNIIAGLAGVISVVLCAADTPRKTAVPSVTVAPNACGYATELAAVVPAVMSRYTKPLT